MKTKTKATESQGLVVGRLTLNEKMRVNKNPGGLPRTLTRYDVAKILNVSPHKATLLLSKGEIPGRKIGEAWRVLEADLIDYIRGGNRSCSAS